MITQRICANTFDAHNRDCRATTVFRSALVPRPIPIAMESVHAGFPSVAQDYFAGDFSFDEQIIRNPDTTFIITVAGDSMEGAGIWDGDLLVVDRSLEPQADDVVVAILDEELTVKRLIMRGSIPILHPENPRYPDFSPQHAQDLVIWGVVVGNFHSQTRSTRFGSPLPGVTRPGMGKSQTPDRDETISAIGETENSSSSSGKAAIYPFPGTTGSKGLQ